jgi:hypothetical protein
MTREEAKHRLLNIERSLPNTFRTKEDVRNFEALEMAIKALEQEPICPSHGIDCEDCPAYDPCGDVISRQAVLDLAKKGVLISNGNYESVCKAINELPSVKNTKAGHWIPVSERLPEEMGTYLVTLEYKKYGTVVATLWFHNKEIGWDSRVGYAVTAWMPLPKPYEPQEIEVKE